MSRDLRPKGFPKRRPIVRKIRATQSFFLAAILHSSELNQSTFSPQPQAQRPCVVTKVAISGNGTRPRSRPWPLPNHSVEHSNVSVVVAMCDSCGVLLVSFVEHCCQAEHNRVAWRWLLSAAGGCCACLSNFVMSAPRLMEDGATYSLPGRGCGKVMRYTCRFAPTVSSPSSGKPKIGSCEPKYGSGLFCSTRIV